jgi:hypothetical protein
MKIHIARSRTRTIREEQEIQFDVVPWTSPIARKRYEVWKRLTALFMWLASIIFVIILSAFARQLHLPPYWLRPVYFERLPYLPQPAHFFPVPLADRSSNFSTRYHRNGLLDDSNRSVWAFASVPGPTSVLSVSTRLDSSPRVSADSSNANSVNFRNRSECAVVIFFLAASSRYGYWSSANSFSSVAATPLSNWPLANTNATGITEQLS